MSFNTKSPVWMGHGDTWFMTGMQCIPVLAKWIDSDKDSEDSQVLC